MPASAEVKPWEKYASTQQNDSAGMKPWEKYGGTTEPPSPKPGFFGTLVEDLSSIPGAAYSAIRHPLDTASGGATRSIGELKNAYKAIQEGNVDEANESLMRSVPFLGPGVHSVLEALKEGNTGRALARIGEIVGPAEASRLSARDVQVGAKTAKNIVAPPGGKISRATRAVKEAYKTAQKQTPDPALAARAAQRKPARFEPSPREIPSGEPIKPTSGALPSGRRPGPAPQKPAPPKPARAAAARIEPTPREVPSAEPIPPESGTLPSGRKPGPAPAKPAAVPAPRKPPARFEPSARDLPKAEPIPPPEGKLPSGRKPPTAEERVARSQSEPVNAPKPPDKSGGATGETGEGLQYKELIRGMRQKGVTRGQLIAERERVMKEGGFNVDQYNRLLSEISQQEKDGAILAHLKTKNITTAEQIAKLSDEEMAKIVSQTPRPTGKGTYSPKSGAHSRSMAEQRADLIDELRALTSGSE